MSTYIFSDLVPDLSLPVADLKIARLFELLNLFDLILKFFEASGSYRAHEGCCVSLLPPWFMFLSSVSLIVLG
jgi:hypothetical protein